MDYIYTAFHVASLDGTPVLHPLFFKFPSDTKTFGIEHQFLYGDSILVSPVVDEGSTSVKVYMPPEGTYYDFLSRSPISQTGEVTLTNINLTSIPVHIVGGAVLPLRVSGAMTTDEVRKKDFELVVAPSKDGVATGKLYVDDGVSLEQPKQTFLTFTYQNGTLNLEGEFGYPLDVNLSRVSILGATSKPSGVDLVVQGGEKKSAEFTYDETRKVVDVQLGIPFTSKFEMKVVF